MSIENPKKDADKKITIWPQWLATCTLSLAVIGSGLANGWASPYLAQLTSTEANTPLKLTDTEASWVASLLNLGRLAGALLSALCQEYIGRKKVLLLGGVPLTASWIFSICATSVMWLYISRFCSGIGSGMMWAALSLYLSEIANPKIRGSLISMNVNASSVGMFLGNAMGPYLSMEMFGYVSLVPSILFMILFSLIPESPYHYLLHGNIDKAEASLKWFRRESDVKAEMRDLQEFVDGAETNIFLKLKEFLMPSNLKKPLVIIGVYVFSYVSGHSALSSYAEIILIKSRIAVKPSLVVTILGFSTIVAGLASMFLVDKFGRKCFLIMSGIGTSMSLALLGLHFHLLSLEYDPNSLTWLPIVALLTFNLSMSCGLQPIPSTLLGEMFTANMKNMASLFVSSSNALLSFASAKSYQPFLDLVGDKFVYWTYSICVLFSAPYVYFLIPETSGKSLIEIQRSIKK
ncbi:facilitated trehalose transporter Tret1-like [Bombus vosnesenskii]|uniref:Facilitated trehalose transporter Tret1-like n=2 Tax=Pyrobombus TaxID=144703 RepID=A0A6J3LJJ7_9HYME|nr:facilitated trehalose transporter Tret1-like [Bombus impatiens]XP_033365688.1 facilitated trehalose transporter Tret1-like [Bombus vosnesenskii]XP_050489993.1 facilitated trehalose transporter Tret1-like [Bombus huntii]